MLGGKMDENENFDQVAMGRADAEKQFQEAIDAGREEGENMCTDMISLACQVCIWSVVGKVEENMDQEKILFLSLFWKYGRKNQMFGLLAPYDALYHIIAIPSIHHGATSIQRWFVCISCIPERH